MNKAIEPFVVGALESWLDLNNRAYVLQRVNHPWFRVCATAALLFKELHETLKQRELNA